MPTYIEKGRTESFTPAYDDNPAKLRITYSDGRHHDLEGDEAVYNYSGAEGEVARRRNPALAAKYKVNGPADKRQFLGYKIGKGIRDYVLDPSSFHNRVLSTGPWTSGLAGAGVGLLGGVLANWISDTGADMGLMRRRGIDYRWVGPLLGAAAGGGLGYLHKQSAVKEAAMYKDSRNAILEALIDASDVSSSDKVKLAAAVRALSREEADLLYQKVRESLGHGVGRILAEYLGISIGGELISGILGVLETGAVHDYMNQQNQHLFYGRD